MPVPIPPRTALSRRGRLIADQLAALRISNLELLQQRARILPRRLRLLMQGDDPAEDELSRLAMALRIDVADLVQP